jgi:RHS repeat-associated protein
MAGISDKAMKTPYAQNKYRFNGGVELQNQEFSDGSGLEMYETTFRGYDPQLGRFWQIDPLADISEDESPYSFANNNPILFNDPFGLLSDSSHPQQLEAAYVTATKKSSTAGPDVAAAAGPAPTKAPSILKEELTHEQHNAYVNVMGYDPHDPVDQMLHTVVQQPTLWQGFVNGPMYEGKNALGGDIYRNYYGGTAPVEGSFDEAEGISGLLKLRSARSWEELFEWGHNTDIIAKLKSVSGSDITRLKNAGVTLEQVKTWGKFYEAAISQKANVSNLTAKFRLDYVNKLIQLW